MLLRILKPFAIVGFVFGSTAAFAAAQQPQAAPQQAAPAPSGEAASGKTPKAAAESAEKGQLKSPMLISPLSPMKATRNTWPPAAMAVTGAVVVAAWARL